MIGKWNVLRGDNRREDPEKMRLGGLVSLEELTVRPSSSSGKSNRMKTPKLSLGKRAFGRRGSRRIDTSLSPPLHSASIFDNFPSAEYVTGFEVRRTTSSEHLPAVISRPHTTDPIGRRRSKTAPPTPHPQPTVDAYTGLQDKPLSFSVDLDTKSKTPLVQSVTHYEEKEVVVEDFQKTLPPRTGSVTRKESLHGRQHTSDSSMTTPPRGVAKLYSLTPSASPSHSESRHGSRTTISQSTSNASTTSASHMERRPSQASSIGARSRSRPLLAKSISTVSTPNTTSTTIEPPDMSILDEVEGTLTATITELQELQGEIVPDVAYDSSPRSATTERPNTGNRSRHSSGTHRPSDTYFTLPQSARESQLITQPIHDPHLSGGSQSLPPTPLRPMAFPGHQDAELQSVRTACEDQKRQLQAMSVENDMVRRQFSFMRTRMTELDSEREMHVRTNREAQENVQTALQRLRDARVGEAAAQREMQAARNEITLLQARCKDQTKKADQLALDLDGERNKSMKLEAKLEEVNTQKIDLLERELETRMDIVVARKKLRKASEELSGIRGKSNAVDLDDVETKLREALKRNEDLESHIRDTAHNDNDNLHAVVTDVTLRLEDAEKRMMEKDALIGTLEKRIDTETEATSSLQHLNAQLSTTITNLKASQTRSRSTSPSGSQITEFQKRIENLDASVRSLRAEREQFAQLLLAEARRTACEVHGRDHPAGALLRQKVDLDEAIEMVRSRAKVYLKDSAIELNDDEDDDDWEDVDASRRKVVDLEKEIEYYLNDIVLYKLDVKGYKKDLRKARERIRELSSAGGSRGTPTSLANESPSLRGSGPIDTMSPISAVDESERPYLAT